MAKQACAEEQLTAIVVTHEHGDHIQGVSRLAKRFNIPVFCTAGTLRSNKIDPAVNVTIVHDMQSFTLGDLAITPVTVPHDAKEPCQFYFQAGDKKLGVLTDLGFVSMHVQQAFHDCHALLLEANHDCQMLQQGPYPESLKRRVGGQWGHLNNDQAVQFLQSTQISALDTLVLGHISEQNNHLDIVKSLFEPFSARVRNVVYATQQEGFSWLSV